MNSIYTTVSGDTWDIISFKNYGDEHFVSELIDQNWQHRNTFTFKAGVQINLPQITTQQQQSANLPPWSRNASA